MFLVDGEEAGVAGVVDGHLVAPVVEPGADHGCLYARFGGRGEHGVRAAQANAVHGGAADVDFVAGLQVVEQAPGAQDLQTPQGLAEKLAQALDAAPGMAAADVHGGDHGETLVSELAAVSLVDVGGVIQAEDALGGGADAVLGDDQGSRGGSILGKGEDAASSESAEKIDGQPAGGDFVVFVPRLQDGLQVGAVAFEEADGAAPALAVEFDRLLEGVDG